MVYFCIYEKYGQYCEFWYNFMDQINAEFIIRNNVENPVRLTNLISEVLSIYKATLTDVCGPTSIQFEDDQMAEIFLLKYS